MMTRNSAVTAQQGKPATATGVRYAVSTSQRVRHNVPTTVLQGDQGSRVRFAPSEGDDRPYAWYQRHLRENGKWRVENNLPV